MSHEYIYLLQEREFIKTNETIYKIGKTKQPNLKRFQNYPKGSKLIFQIICNNCNKIEKDILILFRKKYILQKDIGLEYFKGNYNEMIKDIYNIVYNISDNTILKTNNDIINDNIINDDIINDDIINDNHNDFSNKFNNELIKKFENDKDIIDKINTRLNTNIFETTSTELNKIIKNLKLKLSGNYLRLNKEDLIKSLILYFSNEPFIISYDNKEVNIYDLSLVNIRNYCKINKLPILNLHYYNRNELIEKIKTL